MSLNHWIIKDSLPSFPSTGPIRGQGFTTNFHVWENDAAEFCMGFFLTPHDRSSCQRPYSSCKALVRELKSFCVCILRRSGRDPRIGPDWGGLDFFGFDSGLEIAGSKPLRIGGGLEADRRDTVLLPAFPRGLASGTAHEKKERCMTMELVLSASEWWGLNVLPQPIGMRDRLCIMHRINSWPFVCALRGQVPIVATHCSGSTCSRNWWRTWRPIVGGIPSRVKTNLRRCH